MGRAWVLGWVALLVLVSGAHGLTLELESPSSVTPGIPSEWGLRVGNPSGYILYPRCSLILANDSVAFPEVALGPGGQARLSAAIPGAAGPLAVRCAAGNESAEASAGPPLVPGERRRLGEPRKGPVTIVRSTVLEEVLSGETRVVSLVLQGGEKEWRGEPEVRGLPPGWGAVVPVTVPPRGEVSWNLPITVPAGTPPGEYPVRVLLEAAQAEFVLRVREPRGPTVARSVRLDYVEQKSLFLLRIVGLEQPVARVVLLDSQGAGGQRYDVAPQPFDGETGWLLRDLDPRVERSRTLSFEAPGLLPDAEVLYGYRWRLLLYPEPGEPLQAAYRVSPLRPGGLGSVEAVVVNRDSRPRNATLEVLLPPGWSSPNSRVAVDLEPREQRVVSIPLQVAPGAEGVHILAATLTTGGEAGRVELNAYVSLPGFSLSWLLLLGVLPPVLLVWLVRRRIQERRRRARLRVLRRIR
ncbi:MAG: hypothetical protein HY558_07625 [Euryarchaeota archaeon]|nr:hypothetical protein [Euryarchaeota archaeon]